MSFFKRLGLVEEKEPPVQKKSPSVTQQTTVVPMAIPVNSDVKPSQDFDQHLEDVMKANNLPGPDYLEFAQSLVKLEGKPLTEAQKYENIFLTFGTMGVTPDKLIKGAGHYLTILQMENESFTGQLNKSRQEAVTNVNKQIAADEKALQELSLKIQKSKLEVEKAAQKLAVNESSFNIAFQQRVNTINDHISKIKNYLTNVNAQS